MSTAFLPISSNRQAHCRWLCSFVLLLLFFAAFREKPGLASSSKVRGTNRTALVELFTSEGCSSCPAADELLPLFRKQNVFVLEFHVDYWDRLGWKDPFSDAAFSARQRAYAQRFRLSSLYTPEAVINGHAEQVGSDRGAISQAIDQALADGVTQDEATLQLSTQENHGRVTVNYVASGKAVTDKNKPVVVCLALVQLNAVSKIGAGENRGRTLSHVNLVRGLKTEKTGTGSVAFDIPDGLKPEDLGITGWIQETANGDIETVSAVGLK